jgi:hypothetical protein
MRSAHRNRRSRRANAISARYRARVARAALNYDSDVADAPGSIARVENRR